MSNNQAITGRFYAAICEVTSPRRRDGMTPFAPLQRNDRCFVAGLSATRSITGETFVPAGRSCPRFGTREPRLGLRRRDLVRALPRQASLQSKRSRLNLAVKERSHVRDERQCAEEPLEVSRVRARSSVIAVAAPCASPVPRRATGRLLAASVCLRFAAAVLTTTPATATSDIATAHRIVEPPAGGAVVMARINRPNNP
jgi:hypothetical protein